MNEEFKDRVLFPVVVPVGILAGIFLVLFLFSRILLNVPKGVAVAVALLTGLNVLIFCAIVSVRRVRGFAVLALLIAVLIPSGFGTAAAAGWINVHQPKPAGPAKPTGPAVFKLAADNTAFSTSTINLQEAGGDATIDFTNNDSVPHNVHIFSGTDATGATIFTGTVVSPGASATYKVTGLQPGTYYFRCDIHPAIMTGKVVATAFTGAGGPSNNVAVSANNTAFNKTSLSFSAGQPISIKFANDDSVPHNIHIFQGTSDTGTSEFAGTIANAGQTLTYNVPALPAGTYFFHCDVHPAVMTGTISVT